MWIRKLLVVATCLALVSSSVLAGADETPATNVTAPVPLSPIEVPYPEGGHGEAEVVLEVLVAADGTVSRLEVRTGSEPFASAARASVAQVRFEPAKRNDIPTRARISVRIAFHEPAAAPSPAPPPARDPEAPASSSSPPPPPPPPQPPPSSPTEVVVLGEQRIEVGSIHIPREEARRVPGAFGDPFRVVEVLPGVAPVLSGLPYFYVRGAPPGSVGYLIDGIRVPVLFHVGPGPSVVTPLMIDRVDLFPGAYPARFGRFAGAVFAGETARPRSESHFEGQARVFDASAATEHPFADGKGSVLLGGRYSYTQALLAAVAPDYGLGYGDYQARLSYAVTPNDRVSVFAFGGYDNLENRNLGIKVFDVGFHRADLRWDHVLAGGRLRIGATYANDSVLTAPEDKGAPGTILKSNGGRIRTEFERELSPFARLRFGGDFGADYIRGDREQGDLSTRAYPDRTDFASGAYGDVILRPTANVEVVPGARFDLMRSRGQRFTFFDPRLGTRTKLARGITYLAGFGMAHQVPAYSTRMPGIVPSALEQATQEAVQTTQGVEYALPSGMLGRTTLFYSRLEVENPDVRGRSFGLEQFVRRDFTKKLGGFVSYTLSRAEGSTEREMHILSSFDRTHVVSAVLGYDFGSGFRLGTRAYFASGRAVRVACPTPNCTPGEDRLLTDGTPFNYRRDIRLPSFFRLDLRFEKKWMLSERMWITATAEWFNSLLTTEVQEAYWTPASGIFLERQTALTLPSVGVEVGW
jgi:TonB family protein